VTALTLCLIASGICAATAAGLFFAGAVKAGLMEDLEDVKYRMLREDEDK
jgi:hypothetical protein